jgi:hypothetical protein
VQLRVTALQPFAAAIAAKSVPELHLVISAEINFLAFAKLAVAA